MKGTSDCTSDVKVVDQDDKQDDELSENDEEVKVDEAECYDQSIQTAVAGAMEKGDTVDPALQEREHHYLEAARKERMDFLASEAKKIPPPASKQDRLDYLIAQSDVFAHFLAGSIAANAKRGTSEKKKSSGSRGRMTEAEEDDLLMKTADSKRKTIRLAHQPSLLASHCKMHPYQLEGLNWLIKLHDHGMNGILADEMGLGKTLQTISLIAYLREYRGVTGPHLVIVPKSVVGNWIREFRMWCPMIRPIRMGGCKEERQKVVQESLIQDEKGNFSFDVLVISYEGVLKEKSKLAKINWEYLIIDEAHRIKNENSSLSQGVRMMKSSFRLLITGTPLQNNLHELWALLNFLLPDIFGDADQFDEWFSLADDQGQENVIRKLHTVLRPFMLRRVKKDVACDLPPKKETKLYVGLTDMQQTWYTKILQKDAHELNALGGPDRVRLLNILMQLRKCCNHPYLFDGAEPGPPYTDGPHLWENSGKMQLMHKLLSKLKENGSRVLIFSQMTRVLDILEDYCRLVGHQYCRIDGSTDGERRDAQMDEFNAENSSKFCFLLSTRAGGLGINLATADIVILYDSDWNPQVDLQAQDRAHRIGQKKPVHVFRLVTEGTVEEKIIERADRKLFLDAAVIQQGRLAEQHSSLEKDELMKMVRFGADQILNCKGGTYTDEDIDALIARGEERTIAMQAKLQTDVKHNLANFTLLADDENGIDTFSFGGKNYREDSRKNLGNFITLPQRERKRNYDVNEYFRDIQGSVASKPQGEPGKKKIRKGPATHDFQLFDQQRLKELAELEESLLVKRNDILGGIKQLRDKAKSLPVGSESSTEIMALVDQMDAELCNYQLSKEEREEYQRLQEEGFPDWSRKDYKCFTLALERYGRYNLPAVLKAMEDECGKSNADVKMYYVQFWLHYTRIAEHEKVIERITKGEQKINRLRKIRDAIQEKVERHLEDVYGSFFWDAKQGSEQVKLMPNVAELLQYSWPKMKINYGNSGKGRCYQEEEDAFLICMMHRHGYGAAERIRMEIRRACQFRLDWYFKSRSAAEIQKRCDVLVRMIEKENYDFHKNDDIPTIDETEAMTLKTESKT